MVNGNFDISFGAVATQGPAFAHVGAYDVVPSLDLKFEGRVLLPVGAWQIGFMQFIWDDRLRLMYSAGGEQAWSFVNLGTMLDNDKASNGIWFKGTVHPHFVNSVPERRLVSLSTSDRPGVLNFHGIAKRCAGTIAENLVWCERTFLAFAVIGCREIGGLHRFFPLLATNLYGFYWYLTPAPGSPDVKWKPIPDNPGPERPPFSGPARFGLPLDGTLANDADAARQKAAQARYEADCGRRTPPDSVEKASWSPLTQVP
jgi:hypothetical protein